MLGDNEANASHKFRAPRRARFRFSRRFVLLRIASRVCISSTLDPVGLSLTDRIQRTRAERSTARTIVSHETVRTKWKYRRNELTQVAPLLPVDTLWIRVIASLRHGCVGGHERRRLWKHENQRGIKQRCV